MPAVWLLAVARFLAQAGRFLVQVHLVAFLAVVGYDPLLAASAIGVMGLVHLVSRPTMGALSDAMGREIVLTLEYGLHILALTVLMLLGNSDRLWPVMIFVGLSGFCDGIGGLVTSAKVADLFPARSLGTVMGIMEGSVKLAYMSAPLVGGVLFDRQGDYQTAFIMAMGLMAAAAVLFWGMPLTSRRIPTRMSLHQWPEKGVVSVLVQHTNVRPDRSRVHHARQMNASTKVHGVELWVALRQV
jgi:MFS family permease